MSYESDIELIKRGDRFCEFNGGTIGTRYVALEDGKVDGEYVTVVAQELGSQRSIIFSASREYLYLGPEIYMGDHSIPYMGVTYTN